MNKTNQNITFKGNKLTIKGKEIKEGDNAPTLRLVGTDMGDVSWDKFSGKAVIVSVVPSVDTPTCSLQTKRFNQEAGKLKEIAIVTVSMDLPFAQSRWCQANEVENLVMGSDYKYRTFGEAWGTYIEELGLLTRAIFVVGKDRKVSYIEYVASISDEPNYDAAISAVKKLI